MAFASAVAMEQDCQQTGAEEAQCNYERTNAEGMLLSVHECCGSCAKCSCGIYLTLHTKVPDKLQRSAVELSYAADVYGPCQLAGCIQA